MLYVHWWACPRSQSVKRKAIHPLETPLNDRSEFSLPSLRGPRKNSQSLGLSARLFCMAGARTQREPEAWVLVPVCLGTIRPELILA